MGNLVSQFQTGCVPSHLNGGDGLPRYPHGIRQLLLAHFLFLSQFRDSGFHVLPRFAKLALQI